jgi:hypothetical protein
VTSRWLGRAFWLLVFAPLTAFLAFEQSRQAVDPQNHALKDPASDAQRNLERLAEVVPGDAVVLLGFTVPGDLAILPADRAELDRCRRDLEAIPGVVAATMLPAIDPGHALMTVALRPELAGPAAQQVVAVARAGAQHR